MSPDEWHQCQREATDDLDIGIDELRRHVFKVARRHGLSHYWARALLRSTIDTWAARFGTAPSTAAPSTKE